MRISDWSSDVCSSDLESATMIKPGIDDFRYSELVQRTERRWERRLRPFGQLLWGILRLSFALPAAWNIRGQERSLVDTVTWDLERLPISSFTLAKLGRAAGRERGGQYV